MKPKAKSSSLDTLGLREEDGGCLIPVKVTPRSFKNEILGVGQGRLRVRLQAPPVEGAANRALEEFLASVMDCPKSGVTVIRGGSGREKLVRLDRVTPAMALGRLLAVLG